MNYDDIKADVERKKKEIKKLYAEYKEEISENDKAKWELKVTTILALFGQEEKLRYQVCQNSFDEIGRWYEKDVNNWKSIGDQLRDFKNPKGYSQDLKKFEFFEMDYLHHTQAKIIKRNPIGFYENV